MNPELKKPRPEALFARSAVFAAAGLLIWAADFLFLYVFAALACERGFAQYLPYASAAATLLAAAATIAVMRAGLNTRGLIGAVAAGGAALALIAIAFIALPALLLRGAC